MARNGGWLSLAPRTRGTAAHSHMRAAKRWWRRGARDAPVTVRWGLYI